MLHFDLLVIGFGKAGKTLAAKMASQGKKVGLVEQDPAMYGGTCINIGCIPTKTLIRAAEQNQTFSQVMEEKNAVTGRLNKKNYAMLDGAGVTLFDARARFVSDKVIQLQAGTDQQEVTADIIVINTGAVSNQLPIPGLLESQNVYDSTGIQNLSELPKNLGVLGAGPIGLEFASLYNRLGSKVTILDAADTFLPRSEASLAQMAKGYLEEDGIQIHLGVLTQSISNTEEGKVLLNTNQGDFEFDALLYATGRKPNIQNLGLENTGIAVTDRGAIQVDQHLQTTVPGVFAVGDINGGPQFTYISLDDFRIVYNYLAGDGGYNLENRKNIPNAIFISPTLAQVGLTEAQAQAANLPYKAKEMPVAGMPRAHVDGDLRGAFKAVVNTETKEILGVSILSQNAQEIINLITMAMDNKIPYTYLAQQIFTHPTLAENLNDLFNI
ncbi:FAD-containing oxidoreductase [Streptococcus sp. 121]|uniref:FAD-containing oxidoreductase n=1 Tax=Streptococcus sp. 121 TaxID=2797637 RepID=UPI0018F0806C|nr:FAD-containing oxidoreductase [Streptococcus sp. 121]MBJ6746610.1 FAD-containing oxidoreductase [Streptococcus sp. 121]